MGKHTLRKDKTCLNCNYVVENRYCPNCGQENVETRKTFHHLFVHFFEDLTHYENAFWKTIRNLLLKPASLTREYLSGKRMSYLAPVRLYIFISFVTFLFVAIKPDGIDDKSLVNVNHNNKPVSGWKTGKNGKETDSVAKTDAEKFDFSSIGGYKSVHQLDSLQQYGKKEDKLDANEYWLMKKLVAVAEKNTGKELIEKFKESFIHNLPKVLFIYMPMFAFALWVFQDKKKWYYFDHGIFTLHYFSFLLLVHLILALFDTIFGQFGDFWLFSLILGLINFVGYVWMFYYFFPAHHRFYGETRAVSAIKGIVLFFINMFLISVILMLFAVYTFINLH